MDVASGPDNHLDITFELQLVESSSLVSVLFREALNHPYISCFHLLVYYISRKMRGSLLRASAMYCVGFVECTLWLLRS